MMDILLSAVDEAGMKKSRTLILYKRFACSANRLIVIIHYSRKTGKYLIVFQRAAKPC